MNTDKKTIKINFNTTKENDTNNKFEKKYIEIIEKINEKIKQKSEWILSPNCYFLYKFFGSKGLKTVLNYKIDQKEYKCQIVNFNNNENSLNKIILNNSSDEYSKKLIKIVVDSIENIRYEENNKSEEEISNILNETNDKKNLKSNNVPVFSANEFKNFEYFLILNKFNLKYISEQEFLSYKKALSNIYYYISGGFFIIMAYSPNNEHYFNPKLPEYYKAPNISVFLYSKDEFNEREFFKNYEMINNYFKSIIEYIFLSEMNQNIINAMGEASLIAQYWITKSINKILNDYDIELKRSKNSNLLGELIVKHILSEKIDGVENIEVYPFDRIFYINKPLFSQSNKDKKDDGLQLIVYEGLLETKMYNEKVKEKKFINNSKYFVYEWEREKLEIELEKLNLSNKVYKKIEIDLNELEKESLYNDLHLENDYNKNEEAIFNNFIYNLFTKKKEKNIENIMLEYQKNYFDQDGITYLYLSGVDLYEEIKNLYELQKKYLNTLDNNKFETIEGIDKILKKDYSKNSKVVIFSYNPSDKEFQDKGFTLIIIANKDMQKSILENKSEKDDLLTVLKLLINQHFVIDKKYRQQSEKEFEEMKSSLLEIDHKLQNLFSYSQINDNLKKQVKNFIKTYIKKYEEVNIEPEERCFNTSKKFFRAMFTTRDKENNKIEEKMNIYFETEKNTPWKEVAKEILDGSKYDNIEIDYNIGGKNVKKVEIKLNITETPPFKVLWKDSFFNEYIYVMLKNSFESIKDYLKEQEEQKNEIININIFLTEINKNNFINVEIINKMNGITKEIFENINSKNPFQKNNPLKENSNGIGIKNIKTKIDSIYGLDKANLKFILKDKNTMISLLRLPIEISYNEKELFVPEPSTYKFLYVEDDKTYVEKNKKLFKKKKILPKILYGYNKKDNEIFKNYNLLITDLNIPNIEGNTNSRNGKNLIKDFIKDKSNYIVIILSGDNSNDITKEKVESINNFFEIKKELNKIYRINKKELDENDIKKIEELIDFLKEKTKNEEKRENTQKEDSKNEEKKGKIMFNGEYEIKEENLKYEEDIKSNEVNGKLFLLEDNLDENINKWFNIYLEDIDEYIKNPENRLDGIYTQLIIKVSEINYPLFYEGLKNNILFIPKNIKNDQIKELAEKADEICMYESGIFSKIRHDILNKMKNVNELLEQNNKLQEQFEELFQNYIKNKKDININDDIQQKFENFIKNIKDLNGNIKESSNIDKKSYELILDKISTIEELYKKLFDKEVKNES